MVCRSGTFRAWGSLARRARKAGRARAARSVDALQPERLFDDRGQLIRFSVTSRLGRAEWAPNPHANGGKLTKPLDLPKLRITALEGPYRKNCHRQIDARVQAEMLVTRTPKPTTLASCPDGELNRLGAVFNIRRTRCFPGRTIAIDDHVCAQGRVMEVLSEHNCEGWLEGYCARWPGPACSRPSKRSGDNVIDDHAARKVDRDERGSSVARARAVAQLSCSRRPAGGTITTGSAIKGPASWNTIVQEGYGGPRVLAAGWQLLASRSPETASEARTSVNLIVIDSKPAPVARSWRPLGALRTRRLDWKWAGTEERGVVEGETEQPDVVLACAGDIPTLETLAAAASLHRTSPRCAFASSTWSIS